MIWIGLAILIATIYALVKRYETRMVLIAAGFAMAILAGKPMGAFDAFTKAMVNANLVQNILSVMGFAYVMKYTKCDAHLVHGVTGVLRHVRLLLVPGAALVTFFINISLPSAAGCAAAVGAILIPLLISQGVAPAMAGSAVMLGTFGSMLSPGLTHNIFVAKIANVPVMDVIAVHHMASLASIVVAAACLTLIAILRKEVSGFKDEAGEYAMEEGLKVNPLYAVIPTVPVIMLVLGAVFPQQLPWLKSLGVAHCMLIGVFLGMLVTRSNPAQATKEFFAGTGAGYASVMGIIIAAGVFVGGLNAVGLVQAGIDLMKGSEGIAKLAAALGPFALAVISGSGDAATLAFNEAITPHAAMFNTTILDMGSLATLAGCLGRTMSPLAGAAIICAALAKVNPLEIAKRNALGCVLSLVVAYVMLA